MAGRILLVFVLAGYFLFPGATFAQNDATAPNPPAATEQQAPISYFTFPIGFLTLSILFDYGVVSAPA